VINSFERKDSAFIVWSVQRQVSNMPSCGCIKLRFVLTGVRIGY